MGSENRWPVEHEHALTELVKSRRGSSSDMADLLNRRFGCNYTRNSICGKIMRLGLSNPLPVNRKDRVIRMKSETRKSPPPRRNKVGFYTRPIPVSEVRQLIEKQTPKHLSFEAMVECNGCRWPYGDGPFTWCGNKRMQCLEPNEQSSYCEYHAAVSGGRIQELHAKDEQNAGSY